MGVEARRLELFQALGQPDRSGRPKYQRLADTMVEAIKRGLWRPGDQLPAEDELTAMTPFSLGTVQRAMRDLAEQGLLVRQHGLGTFVAERPREIQKPWHCRFLADDGVTVLPVYSKTVHRVIVKEEGPWNLHLRSASGQVMRLDRVISINREFSVFSRFYGDRALLKKLWDLPMDRLDGVNFQQMLSESLKLPITDIKHLVAIAGFDGEAARHVGVEPGAPGIFLRAVAHAGRDLCVYYQEFSIPRSERSLEIPEHTPSYGSA
jgi:GntR family transcriptional regulator